MRVVVFSDSHGNPQALQKIARIQADAEVFIHLGDGERDFAPIKEQYPETVTRSVRGNSDWGSDSPLLDTLVLEKKRILFAHGHTFNVKQSPALIISEARITGASIVLYGHTHVAKTDYVDGIYLLNPGSVSSPRYGKPTYGIIDITETEIMPRIASL